MVTFILPQRRNAFITVHIFEHGRLVHGMYKIHTLVPVQKARASRHGDGQALYKYKKL
jgi:hypothetical protein